VLLLDENEKAHPDIYTILLQVMDHGTLTDNNGRKADFRNVIIVMSTNCGAEQVSRASIGFATQDHSTDGMEAIKRTFSPEFRNRLDAIIQFSALAPQIVTQVVDKFIIELEAQLEERKVSLMVDNAARAWLGERGFDAKMGARPMARTIQDHIKKPLAEELLFGRLAKGGHVRIGLKNDALSFDIEGVEETVES
jgi:ATP-dependent Clp protease ATP-binding subunit ClpA